MKDQNKQKAGYKKTTLAWIPNEWALVSFEKCCRIAEGMISPTQTRFINYRHIGPENIESDTGRILNVRTAQDLGLRSWKYLFDSSSIIYSKIRPNLNKACLPTYDGMCSADCYPIWAINGCDREYLFSFIRSPIFLKQSISVSLRTGMPKINRADLNRIKIILPPIHEQVQIAKILIAWDTAIEQTRKLISSKKNNKKALMQQLLKGRKRLPGFNDPWKEYYLKGLFSERKETNGGHLPLLAITGKKGIILASEIDRKDSSSEDKSRYKKITPGDIGYNTMRMWQGVSAVSDMEGIVSPAYTICKPKKGVDVIFMGHLFKMPSVVHLFWRFSQGLVNDTLNLKFHHFAQIKIKIPEIKEQIAIAKVLTTIDNEIKYLEKKMAAMEKQKRGLMQKLLTGEVRVKV